MSALRAGRDEGDGEVVRLPDPLRRRSRALGDVDVVALEADLHEELEGEVRFDPGSLGAYSTDGSNFRQVPIGIVIPSTIEDAVTAVQVWLLGTPVL